MSVELHFNCVTDGVRHIISFSTSPDEHMSAVRERLAAQLARPAASLLMKLGGAPFPRLEMSVRDGFEDHGGYDIPINVNVVVHKEHEKCARCSRKLPLFSPNSCTGSCVKACLQCTRQHFLCRREQKTCLTCFGDDCADNKESIRHTLTWRDIIALYSDDPITALELAVYNAVSPGSGASQMAHVLIAFFSGPMQLVFKLTVFFHSVYKGEYSTSLLLLWMVRSATIFFLLPVPQSNALDFFFYFFRLPFSVKYFVVSLIIWSQRKLSRSIPPRRIRQTYTFASTCFRGSDRIIHLLKTAQTQPDIAVYVITIIFLLTIFAPWVLSSMYYPRIALALFLVGIGSLPNRLLPNMETPINALGENEDESIG